MHIKKNLLSLSLCSVLLTGIAGCTVTEIPKTEPETESAELPAGTGIQTAARVKAALHSQASTTSGRILAAVPAGSALEIVSEEGDWTRVIYNNQCGYVYNSFLAADAYQPDLITVGSVHTITNDQLNAIAASYDGSPQGFGAGKSPRDEQNRSVYALNLEEDLTEFDALFFGDKTSNTIYLSFSLGWENAPNTATILDTLAANNIKGVFYINHEYAEKNPDLVRRMIDEGHEIGNHGYTHPADGMPSLSLEEQMNDAMQMQSYMYETFGYTMRKYNFSSSSWSMQSAALMTAMGYRVCFYSFNYADYDTASPMDPADVHTLLMDALAPGCIYYLHPVSTGNTGALASFIADAQAAGYKFGILP